MKSLFTLLKIGLNLKEPSVADIELFKTMSQTEWEKLRSISDQQGVTAIVLDGLNALVNNYGQKIAPNVNSAWWQLFILDWFGLVNQIEQKNKQQIMVMDDLFFKWTSNNCKVMIFKGQACGLMYPSPNHRSPGDVDCYLFGNYSRGNEIAKQYGASVDDSWYKHSVIYYKGEIFENHQYFVLTRGGKRGKELENELVTMLNGCQKEGSSSIIKPPAQWVASFLTYHACGHFLSEGLKLKQLLDWAMFLHYYQEQVNWNEFSMFCEKYHLKRFSEAISAICVHYLGVKALYNSINIDSPYSERVLNSILYDDDYVFSSGESGWNNRFHLVLNTFRYRWKYHDIYQESIFKHLWYNITGYLFHTE